MYSNKYIRKKCQDFDFIKRFYCSPVIKYNNILRITVFKKCYAQCHGQRKSTIRSLVVTVIRPSEGASLEASKSVHPTGKSVVSQTVGHSSQQDRNNLLHVQMSVVEKYVRSPHFNSSDIISPDMT